MFRRCLVALALLLAPLTVRAQQVTEAPALTGPFDGVIVPYTEAGQSIPLGWTDVDNEQGYEIEIALVPIAGQPTTETRTTSANAGSYDLTVFPLATGGLSTGTYTWRVRGFRGPHGAPTQVGPWSPARTFRVYLGLPYEDRPDIYPNRPDNRIDYRDVFSFALGWQSSEAEGDYKIAADLTRNGRIDATDLRGLVSYIKTGDYDALLPEPVIIVPATPDSTWDFDAVAGGTTVTLTWQRQSAMGYHVNIAYVAGSTDEDFLVFVPDPGQGNTVSLVLDPYIVEPALYNVRVAGISMDAIEGHRSAYWHFDVLP